jgi:hypothetical protein
LSASVAAVARERQSVNGSIFRAKLTKRTIT